MFSPRTLIVVCHGCGAFYELETAFLSSSVAVGFESTRRPGVRWVIPGRGCNDCLSVPGVIGRDHRRTGPIADAYTHGMSPAARTRSLAEFAVWEERLEAEARRNGGLS